MSNVIEVKHVSKTFNDFALKDISFHVPAGHIVGFIGENGAGKSTTINCILRELSIDKGEISLFQELDITEDLKNRIGVVFDEDNFYDTLKLHQVSNMMSHIYESWDTKQFDSYCEKFKLTQNITISKYSRGMKMKLSLAIALSHGSQLLILDEATAGLDPVMRDEILEVFLDFVQDEQHAILISSHITSDLEQIADDILFIQNGEILFQTSKDELLYSYGILKCKKAQFELIDPCDVIRYQKHDLSWSVLVRNKQQMQKKYKDMLMDDITLDNLMLFYAKGECIC